jgi:hypothetical protein
MKQQDQREVEDQECRLEHVQPHQQRRQFRVGDVVLERVRAPPVIRKQFRVHFAQGGDEVDGVVAATEVVAAQGERERDPQQQRQGVA